MSVGSGIRRLEPLLEQSVAGRSSGIVNGSAEATEAEQKHQLQQPVGLGMSNLGSSASIARFPKLDECAHFHYEHVELGKLEVSLSESEQANLSADGFAVRVSARDACWTLQRSVDNLVTLDRQLHRCIWPRTYSQLKDLATATDDESAEQVTAATVAEYFRRFSALSHDGLNCGPVLNWLQLDNRGRRIFVPEALNTPAVAAAYAVRPHKAQAPDELQLDVGDMISVIDMPPAGESSWWRGKRGFDVGFFPAECVALFRSAAVTGTVNTTNINQQQQHQQQQQQHPVKPVLRKHGKLIAFFRSFILNRPSRRRLKQTGILRERVFGCDLGEHLLNSGGREVPSVLTCCASFIERHGLVDGIYRLSGVTSNIQRLRNAFDEDRLPSLEADESILHDIHSVASLLKMYFRELPNPLCTYQLYSTFVSAVQSPSDAERLARMREAVRKLPPPHYRTLEYLMRHLVRVASRGDETGMTPRNVAIVWAPNLLRCKELEVGGVAALQGVGVQAVVTEFLICYAELIFAPDEGSANNEGEGSHAPPLAPIGNRPKSLALAGNRLLSLEEARNRSLAPEPELIEVGAGSAGLPARYHTVIEPAILNARKRSKRSPSLNWRALFGRAKSASTTTASSSASGATGRSIASSAGISRPITITASSMATSSASSASTAQAALGPSCASLPGSRPLEASSRPAEDGLGPLRHGPSNGNGANARSCGHSRSVSHDSYFDLNDMANSAPSAATSALDLSEIQLSFELEEREMRMLSGEESLEVSPRRQANNGNANNSNNDSNVNNDSSSNSEDGTIPGTEVGRPNALMPIGGGSKRKRSRLEERLHANGEFELRFIDSQSPDQIMVSADVHEPTDNTPSPLPTPGYLPLLSEASTPLTPNAASPPAVSPRISFKSFLLPLEVDEMLPVASSQVSAMDACEDFKATPSVSRQSGSSPSAPDLDQEMTLEPQSEATTTTTRARYLLDTSSAAFPSVQQVTKQSSSKSATDKDDEVTAVKISKTLLNKRTVDQDSLMICEHSFDAAAIDQSHETIEKKQDVNFRSSSSRSSSRSSSNCFGEAKDWQMTINTPAAGATGSPQDVTTHQLVQADERLGSTEETMKRLTPINPSEARNCAEEAASPRCPSLVNVHDLVATNSETSNIADLHSPRGDENLICLSSVSPVRESSQPEITDKIELVHTKLLPDSSSCLEQSVSRQVKDDDNNVIIGYENDKSQVSRWTLKMEKDECASSESGKDASIGLSGECGDKNQGVVESRESKAIVAADGGDSGDKRKSLERMASNYVNRNDSASSTKSTGSDADPCSNREDLEVVVPLESAAVEPQEMAHVPDVQADEANVVIRANTSPSVSNRAERNSVVPKDTATILQELALQRLSGGGERLESTLPRRRLDSSDYLRDRRSFDSEIGREIVREHKMKQELENARGKLDDSLKGSQNQTAQGLLPHLPPCLRARHARATRAALSPRTQSLDEAKFNALGRGDATGATSEPRRRQLTQQKQHYAQQQQRPRLGSTPDFEESCIIVNSNSSSSSNGSSRSSLIGGARTAGAGRSTQSLNKNLGLDLDDPSTRERIEKYKEERRTFLRDKYRSESFRAASASSAADGGDNNNKPTRASKPSSPPPL